MRKKTHEEYVAELAIKNPNIEVIGKYLGNKIKIEHHCLIHDIYWDSSPDCILSGRGCKECRKEKIRNKKQKSHEKYLSELLNVNSNIEPVEEYKGTDIAIQHHCKKHNYIWKVRPSNLLKGEGCPKCRNEKISEKNKKPHELYVKEVKIKNPNIKVIGEYINSHKPIKHYCIKHDVFWDATPTSILIGGGYKKCGNEKLSSILMLSHDEYLKKLNDAHPNIELLETYKGSHIPIKHKCIIDNYEWMQKPIYLLHSLGCPKCNSSYGEKTICKWLDNNDIQYVREMRFPDCRDIKPLPFDFYLPEYNKCIEYDGEQHFKPKAFFGGEDSFQVTTKHDKIKNEYCKINGISLLRIPYYKNVGEELNNFLFI